MGTGGAGGNITTYGWDARSNPTSAKLPTGATSAFGAYATIAGVDLPPSFTDAQGNKTSYTYDTAGNTKTVSVTGDGNLRSRTDATGTTTYQPDALNRETVRTLPDHSTTVLSYDPAGNVQTYTDPTGQVVYGYDAANNLHTLKDPSGATTTYTYNNDNILTTTAYPGGTTQTIGLDNSNRPTSITVKAGSTTLVDLGYTYTTGPSSTDGTLVHTRKDNQTSTTTTYAYDAQNRLSTAKESANANWVYCYDPAGNITSTSAGSSTTCPGSTTYSYNDASELTSKNGSTTGWSYNTDGDETTANSGSGVRTNETWSDYNQLTSLTAAGTPYTATYAGTDNGERTSLTAAGTATTFHNGPEGLAASTTNGTDTGFTREPGGTLNSMRTSGKSYYYLTDADGSVLGLVDNTGTRVDAYTYDPAGNARTLTQNTPQPYRFQGAYLDPTGLYKMGARYYDPTLTRFTQTDPSDQETNPYTAFGNNPANNTDPNGTFSLSGILGVGSDVFGAVTGCLSGIGAASETGVTEAASVLGGPVGGAAAIIGSCAAGGFMGYEGADIISYG
ncbi:RHS repeat-associated core domain-containing protein [Streptomyces sp. NPDC088194]|uniref:RHS repeat-associated core domain-containing protein n=1 Tax=Streptomyces sp. NPDC088194 TaxID=3154931 RepID=UPI00344B6C39